jgi:sulfur-carrier protein
MPDSSATPAVGVTVRIVYLARLREAFGRGGESLTLSAADASVADVLAVLKARGEAWSHELAPGRAVRVAVNHDIATSDTRLRDGDEIALLPPVTGG